LNSLLPYSKKLSVILYENDMYYDQAYNNNIKNLIEDFNCNEIISVIKGIESDEQPTLEIEDRNKFYELYRNEIFNLCSNFIQKTVK
jgi:hypothetical protein